MKALDPRDLDSLRRQVQELARTYTPEWRFEWAREDPGAALAELFCQMFGQTVDRFNSIPEKFFIEFLRMTGYQLPGPSCASGVMGFTVHDTVEQPIPVPAGTQLFTPDSSGQNVVYETERSIEATSAALEDVYLVDGRRDSIRRLDLSAPPAVFLPGGGRGAAAAPVLFWGKPRAPAGLPRPDRGGAVPERTVHGGGHRPPPDRGGHDVVLFP